MHDNGELKSFCRETSIKTRLETEVLLTPMFHVYYDKTAKHFKNKNESEIKKAMESFLARNIYEILHKDILEYKDIFESKYKKSEST